MKAKSLAIALMLCLVAQVGTAQTRQEIKQAKRNLADDLHQCSLFFFAVSACVASEEATLALTYRKASDKLDKLALSSSRAAGVSKGGYAAYTFLLAERVMRPLGPNCANIGLPPTKRYMNFCEQLARDAGPRLLEWTNCVHAKDPTCRR